MRPQTNDLTQAPGYLVSQVAPNTFVRPDPNGDAGQRLAELAQSLSALRPGITQVLANSNEKAQADAAYQAQLDEEAQKAQGIKEANLNRALIKKGNLSLADIEEQKRGWTHWRIAGYEMAEGQMAAHDYRDELFLAVGQLGLKETTTPQQIDEAAQAIRQKYAANGEGSGPVWTKTFNTYADQFEAGVKAQVYESINHERTDAAIINTASHISELATAALSGTDQTKSTADFQNYLEQSFLNTSLSASELNHAIKLGYTSAVQQAIRGGHPEVVDQLIENFQQIETPYGKLSETDGGATLNNMMAELSAARRDAKVNAANEREEQRTTLHDEFWTKFISPNYGRPTSQWAIKQADLSEFLGRAAKLGLDTEFQGNLESYKKLNAASTTALFQEEAKVKEQDALIIQRDLLQAGSGLTEPQLATLKQRAYDLAQTPAGASVAGPLLKELNEAEKGFADGSQFTSRVVSDGITRFDRGLTDEIRIQTRALTARLAEDRANGDDAILRRLMGDRTNKFQYGVDSSGQFYMNNEDLQLDAHAEFQQALNTARNGRPWSALTQDEVKQAADTVRQTYSEKIKQSVNDLEGSLKISPDQPTDKWSKLLQDSTPGSKPSFAMAQEVNNKMAGMGIRTGVNFSGTHPDYDNLLRVVTNSSDVDRAISALNNSKNPFGSELMSQQQAWDTLAEYRASYMDMARAVESRKDFPQLLDQFQSGKLNHDDRGVLERAWDGTKAATPILGGSWWNLVNPAATVGNFVGGISDKKSDDYFDLYKWSEARKGFLKVTQETGVAGAKEALSFPPDWLTGNNKVPTMSFHFFNMKELSDSMPELAKHFGWTEDEAISFAKQQIEHMHKEGYLTGSANEALKNPGGLSIKPQVTDPNRSGASTARRQPSF